MKKPPRPMTTDKNRLYMAGLKNLGEPTALTRKSGADIGNRTSMVNR